MLGKQRLYQQASSVLANSTASQTEVSLVVSSNGLTRFAASSIHQNMVETSATVRIRVAVGRRLGVATTNRLESDSLSKCLDRATQMAVVAPDDPVFGGFPVPLPHREVKGFCESTAEFGPTHRATLVKEACIGAEAHGVALAGAISTSAMETAVVNSNGLFAYHPATRASFNVTATTDTGAGYEAGIATSITQLDTMQLAQRATNACVRAKNPRPIEPGNYTVILSPHATRDLVMMMAVNGLGAMSYQEGRSFMNDMIGRRTLHPEISMWDDGLDEFGWPRPFDAEGMPKCRVELIDKGIARGVVYDSYHAGKESGRHSTGHALPPPSLAGPLPTNIFMAAGEASLEEMIQSTSRGLLVTLLHYTRPVVPKRVIVTGITRNGTFLVENGEIAYPVMNLRFNQDYIEALNSVQCVGRTTKLLSPHGPMVISVPALKLARFNFTGVTRY